MISNKVVKQIKINEDNFTYYIGWYGEAPISNSEIKGKRFNKVLIFNIIY